MKVNTRRCTSLIRISGDWAWAVAQRCGPKLQVEACNLIKKRLWYRCFPVNFAKFHFFLQNTFSGCFWLGWLDWKFSISSKSINWRFADICKTSMTLYKVCKIKRVTEIITFFNFRVFRVLEINIKIIHEDNIFKNTEIFV